jgi:phosphatidylserine/phosphatidylglycerophosphate/cardiolipin synthase-like enzyme
MRETRGTHQKILICDRTFAVTGSFNWLSYAGEQDEGYRNETGTLFRHIDQINALATIALQALSS